MKILIRLLLIFLSFIFFCCRKNIEPEVIPELEAFEDVKLLTDSLSIDIKLGDRTSIKTNKGTLYFFLERVNIGCPIIERNCDADTEVDLIISINNDSLFLRHNLSFRYQPFYYTSIPCNSQLLAFIVDPKRIKPYFEVGTNILVKNLIVGVRSIYPYPKDFVESSLFVQNKKFHIILTLQNSCKQ